MLAIHLDDEAEKYLIEILAREKITSQQLVKKLLQDYLANLTFSNQTILEKMGGYPEHLLEGEENLSDRDTRKQIILSRIQEKHEKQQEQ